MSAVKKIYDYSAEEIEDYSKASLEKVTTIKHQRFSAQRKKALKRLRLLMAFKMTFIIVSFMGLMGIVIYQNSAINEYKYDVSSLQNELHSLETQRKEVIAFIEKETDLRKIEEKAVTQLNMQYPIAEQTRYIKSNLHKNLSKAFND